MPRPSRSGSAAALALALGCAASPPPEVHCASEAECPATARCIDQACVANAPPVAAIALPPAPIAANALLEFDGSGSSDPDPGDGVASWAWTFRAVSAPCAPPAVAGTGPTAQVRFACAGSFAVDLTVTDQMSASSPVATLTFSVLPYYGPPLVEAGPDVAVDHACAGTPLSCATTSPIPLSATAPGASGAVAFHWTVTPPQGLALGADRRVTFTLGDAVATTEAAVETDGTAISGDWIFTVEARDAAGVLGTATTRASIRNAPPVVTAKVPTPDHVFDGGQLSASGEITLSIVDPEGDPLLGRTVVWHHSGDGTSLFQGSDLGTRITFEVVVPYASPTDAAFLIGGAGLERSVELTIHDVNGATAHEMWPIVVGNRPPALAWGPALVSVDHAYDPGDAAYEATATLSTWADPDGDPLAQTGPTGDAACPDVTVTAGQASVSCSVPFAGSASVANLAGTHEVTQRIGDPWAQAAAVPVTLVVGNRPPSITSTAPVAVGGTCVFLQTCCDMAGGECLHQAAIAPATTVTVPSRFADPDGDPVDVQVAAAGTVTPVQPLVCEPSACSLELDLADTSVCATRVTTLPMAVTDGAGVTTGSLQVAWSCL